MCEIETYEFKNEALPWHLFDDILTHENWCQVWKLGAQVYEGNQTAIHETHILTCSDGIFLTKVYKYKNKREFIKICQEFAITKTLRLIYYSDIAYGKHDNELYITMGILNYTLALAVTKEEINLKSEINLSYFILEIAGNLYQLHSNNYIHLDIKANNCGFRDKKRPQWFPLGNGWKLFDFNTLKYITNAPKQPYIKLNRYCGTCGWSSPEMSPYATKDKPNIITKKADIWSFGLLILYIINNGENIFDLNDREKEGKDKKEQTYAFYDKLINFDMKTYLIKLWLKDNKINENLYNLLSKMLSYDPKKRPSAPKITRYFKQYTVFENGVIYKKQSENRIEFKQSRSLLPLIFKTSKFKISMRTNRRKNK